ncbi:MAG: histidine kinase [Saprospiraceae bacterium]|nr:histidine kinase [Saprospiraceae bacterium]
MDSVINSLNYLIKTKIKVSRFLLYILLLKFHIAISQAPAFRQYTDEDGLPSMTVYGIKQDLSGYLWLATTKGICRFDGHEFKKYSLPDMKGQDIPYLFMDETGTPWFYNMAGEIFNIENDKIRKIDISSPHPDLTIYYFFVHENCIYITWGGLNTYVSYKYDNCNLNSFEKLPNAYGFIKIHNGKFLCTSIIKRDSCFQIINLKNSKLLYNYKLPSNYFFNYHNETNIFTAVTEDSLFLFTPYYAALFDSQFSLLKSIRLRELVNDTVVYISLINKTELFIKTNYKSVVYNLRNNKISAETKYGVSLNSIMEDRQKRHWVSTTNKGLFLIFNKNLSLYTEDNSKIFSNEIISLKSDFPYLYIGHSNNSISILNQLTLEWKTILVPGARRIKSISRINENNLIVGADNGIYQIQLRDKQKDKITLLKFGSIKDVFWQDAENIIILTSLGTFYCNYNDLLNTNYKFLLENSSINIRSTSLTKFKDTIYIGTVKGLFKKIGSHFEKINLGQFSNLYINKLYTDHNKLYICTDGNGLLVYQNGQIIDIINNQNGLPSNSITCIWSIHPSQIAIGTDNGAYLFNPNTKKGFGFNQLDGLPAKEIVDLSCAQGRLWIGTNKGLASIPIEEIQPNKEKPLVELISSEVFSKSGKFPFSKILPYNFNHLRFKLQTRCLQSKDQLKIYYKLYKNDSNWISTTNKILEFIGLSQGDYELQIKATNEDGIESDPPLIFPFKIEAPWWETTIFKISLLSFMIFSTIGISYWRSFSLKKTEKKQRAILDQINQLRLQALQHQMNPHFIFNSLNAIQSFLGNNEEKVAMTYLSQFGKLIRIIFDQSKLKSISLQEEIELLQHYIYLEELRFKNNLVIKLEVDPILLKYSRQIRIPPLVIQPIVENSFRHGLIHLGAQGKLSIKLELNGNQVQCVVQDNGIGREKSKLINEWKRKNHVSTGIASAAERLLIIDNERDKIGLDIIDLYDPFGNPAGTKVTLVLQIFDPSKYNINRIS